MFGVGKYKTRGGEDVEIVAVVGDVAIGYMYKNPKAANTWSTHTGRFHFESSDESRLDLINPNARKPIKQDLWLTIYKTNSRGVYVGGGYVTKEEAKGRKCNDCIAIAKVTIDCMEGDGLD